MGNKAIFACVCLAMLSGCDQSSTRVSESVGAQQLEDGLAFTRTVPEVVELSLDADVQMDFGNLETQFEALELGAALPNDGRSHIEGEWSASYPWPVAAIHAALLPNGTVMTYGSDANGAGNRAFVVDRWDPLQGLSDAAHELAPTGIDTNVFCSAQTVMTDGTVLISGGDKQDGGPNILGKVNEGIRSSTRYNPNSHTLSKLRNMRFERWYPTLVTLGNGRQLTLGGLSTNEDSDSRRTVPTVPEVYVPRNNRWRVLWGARDKQFYSASWYYPRAWLNKRGTVTVLSSGSDDIYELDPVGRGSFEPVGKMRNRWDRIRPSLPAVMYRPGKVLVMMNTGKAQSVDIDGVIPTSEEVSSPSGVRYWSDTTVLPDGNVFLVGGSRGYQDLDEAVHFGEIWDPESDTWTKARESTDKKARLYHSVSLLLPDASVLVAGGGPPGPVVNMNAELYFPPYLYENDGSGVRAARPEIQNMDELNYAQSTNIVMANDERVSRVTLVRSGSVTHSFDSSQRFMELEFSQEGSVLDVNMTGNRNVAPPGLYMVFVFNDKGVPSVAELKMLK